MNKARINLILQAFSKLDKNGDGQITVQDLKGSFYKINQVYFYYYNEIFKEYMIQASIQNI